MKNIPDRIRILWIVGTVIALCACFLFARFTFFEAHGNVQWPAVLLVVGLVVLCFASIFNCKKVMMLTVLGYIGGFAAGILFGVDGVDPGGGATNNWWMIWTISFIVLIIIGAMWDIICRRKNKHL